MLRSLAVFALSLVFSAMLRVRFTRNRAVAVLCQWATALDSPVRYRVSYNLQGLISRVIGFPVCFYCRWVEFPAKPHPCQDEVDEAWRAIYEEEDARAEEEFENEVCPCGHKHQAHYGDFGACLGCECPDFGTPLDAWEPQLAKVVWYTESPCGHHGYE